ncbi:fam-c protein, fragment [Plasmodium vinckei brucechwatti]|uniref:Fam-c protein n=1 Tax=Plasmodium vinckei brucechwatti TaxID=119398 RepID=A0A6V7RV74_PLAVN|nr:fam-c protein, fragment [Plasmodium vinckei brucechwatti]
MNKKIFSLVCIILYNLLVASIHCLEQEESDARNKSVRGTKEINRSNDEYDKESSGFNIFKRGKKSKRIIKNLHSEVPSDLSSDEMIKIFKDNHKDIPTDRLEFKKYIINILKNDPEQSKFLKKLFGKLAKQPLKYALISPFFNAYISNYIEVENKQINYL